MQITHYLTQALLKGFEIGTKIINVEIIEAVLSSDLNALEPKLARHVYNMIALCEFLNAKRSEVKAYLSGNLNPNKTTEFNKKIHQLGII